MVKFYVIQIKLGRIKINDVPLLWREAVREAIENCEYSVNVDIDVSDIDIVQKSAAWDELIGGITNE